MKLWLINKKSNIFFAHVVFVDKSMLALLVLDFDQESNFSRDFDFLCIVLLSKVMTKKYSIYPKLFTCKDYGTSSIVCFSIIEFSNESAYFTLGLMSF